MAGASPLAYSGAIKQKTTGTKEQDHRKGSFKMNTKHGQRKALFEVYVMNLGNDKGDYFTLSTLEDLIEAEKVVNPMGWNDVEVQLIDCYFPCLKFNFEIADFLRIMDKYSISPEDLGALYINHTYTEVIEILEKDIYFTIIEADTKKEAFQEYIQAGGLLEIPEHLESYIDWNSILIDWECGGLTIYKVAEASKTVPNNKYIIIND